jgi:hypothetical protein
LAVFLLKSDPSAKTSRGCDGCCNRPHLPYHGCVSPCCTKGDFCSLFWEKSARACAFTTNIESRNLCLRLRRVFFIKIGGSLKYALCRKVADTMSNSISLWFVFNFKGSEFTNC